MLRQKDAAAAVAPSSKAIHSITSQQNLDIEAVMAVGIKTKQNI